MTGRKNDNKTFYTKLYILGNLIKNSHAKIYKTEIEEIANR